MGEGRWTGRYGEGGREREKWDWDMRVEVRHLIEAGAEKHEHLGAGGNSIYTGKQSGATIRRLEGKRILEAW